MIRLPSLFSLWQQFRNVLFRFPLQSVIALLAMSLWIWISDNSTTQNVDQFYKLIALCNLAFTLSLASNLYAEYNRWNAAKNFALQLITVLFCALLFFFLSPEFFKADLLRLFLFILAGHLLVSFSVYTSPANVLEFWHFNKTLFLRFITAVVFSMVLFAGLAVALLTIDVLFKYQIQGDSYFKLFIMLAVGFNSIFFLAGVPDNIKDPYINTDESRFADSNLNNSYPKVLKIFTQYVLIPLLTIYFAILVVYELKIAVNAQLPDGMVSILILGYAVFGILSYLLIYPISKESGNEWMRQFSKLFFWLMIPLLVLLFVAIWVRTADYGLTELRYFIILLAIWLSGITIYFISNKSPRIQLIPISLFILIILATYGPQSAANLSKKSQQARLRIYMPKNDQLAQSEKASIVNYLVDYHGLPSLQEFTNKNLSKIQHQILANDSLRKNTYFLKSHLRDTAFSLLAIDPTTYSGSIRYINFVNQEKGISTTGFQYAFWIEHGNLIEEFKSPIGKIETFTKNNQSLVIKIGETDSVLFDMNIFQREVIKRYEYSRNTTKNGEITYTDDNNAIVPAKWMTLQAGNKNYDVEIRVQSISLNLTENKKEAVYLPNFSGFVLISKK